MAERRIDSLFVELIFRGDRRELDKFQRGVDNLNRRIDGLARNFAIAGGALTAALFGVGRTVVRFEAAQNQLQATLDVTDDQMEALRNQAKQLGATTAFSASQVSEAQNQIAQQTGDANKVLASTPKILALAAAGNLEMAEAAKLATGILNAYQLEIEEVSRVSNVMAKAATSGSTTVSEMGPALRQVAPTAAQLGLSVEQTAAMLVQLRNNMLQPEQAGTALRGVLSRLINISGPARDALQKIGVDPGQIQSMARLGDVAKVFDTLKVAGLDVATSMEIFGEEAGNAGTILANSVSDTEALHESLLDVEGASARMASIQQKGIVGALNNFRSALEGLQLELGEAGLTRWIATAVEAVRSLMVWLQKSEGWLKTTMAVVLASGPILLAVGAALKVMTFALSGFVVLVKVARGAVWLWRNALILTRIQMGLLAVQTWLAAAANSNFVVALRLAAINAQGYVTSLSLATLWNSNFVLSLRLAAINVQGFIASLSLARVAQLLGAAATGVATAATWAFNVAVAANPVGLIVLGIAALIAALVLLVMHWHTVKRVVLDVWDSVVGAMQTAWGHIKGFFDRFGNYVLVALSVAMPFIGLPLLIARNWEQIVGVVRGIWDSVVAMFREHWDKALAILFPVAGLPILIARNWGQIVEIVGDVWARVTDTVKGWIDAIIAFVRELPGRVLDAVRAIPDLIEDEIRRIPGLGVALDVAGKAGEMLGLAEGGIVTRPTLSLLGEGAGPEAVIPLRRMAELFTAPTMPLPVAPAGASAVSNSSVVNRTASVTINGPINIQTEATNAREIAQTITQEIDDQIRNVAYEFDTSER